MEKQQTAVEFLVQEINKLTGLTISMDEPCVLQAKEMEKRQKIEFGKKIADHWGMVTVPIENIEQYYNETYKNENE